MKSQETVLNVTRQRCICIFTDWCTTFLAFLAFNIFRFYFMGLGDDFVELAGFLLYGKLILEQLIVPVLLLGVYWISGYYNHPFERSRLQEFLITFYSQLFNAVVIYLAALTNDHLYLRRENWILLLILFLLLFVFVYVGRLCITNRLLKRMKRFNIKPRTVIVGYSDDAVKIARKLVDPVNKPHGHLVGFMPFGNETDASIILKNFPDTSLIENIGRLNSLCSEKKVDQVIVVPPPGKTPTNKILHFLYNLYPYDVSIKISPDIFNIITPSVRLQDILDEPFIDLTSPQTSEFSKNIKRALDVVFSGIALTVLSPLFGIIALAVKRSGPGGIIYSQWRVGIHRKPFKIYKFRSMVQDAEKDGTPRLTTDDDNRITGVGKWMRKYRLDELPQLWNVLIGDMSLVGPRPEREFFIDRIVKKAPWYTLVLQVRPGITSWGMVKYGYASDIEQMIERNRYDLIYLTNMSVAVDFKILIHTVKTVGAGEGK